MMKLLAALATLSFPLAASAGVACHYSYGGETRTLVAKPAKSPYTEPAIQVGSYFLFRVILQTEPADLGSVKIYTYADRDGGPLPLHQASYPYPPPAGAPAPFGFTGLQFIYEPLRDGELQYWCEAQPEQETAR